MPKTMEETAAPEAPSVDMGALLQDMNAKLEILSEENAELRAEVSSQRHAVPQYRPMERPDLHNAGTRRKQVLSTLGAGQKGDGVLEQVPVDHLGHKIPKAMLSQMGPQFRPGDHVRIDPESTREGFPEGQTWGQVLSKVKSDGYGVVQRTLWFGKGGLWKYKVRVPGLTGKSPDGFYESELRAV